MAQSGVLNFIVNGRPFTVDNFEIGTSLNTWLRTTAKLTGTKVMCKEGGCGSCVVMVTRTDPVTSKDLSLAVNSCLFPLLSVDGCLVTTTEGLVTDGGQYNVIQERMAHFNATQCGYCTPGFVMTMHSFLQRNPSPTQEEIEVEFDGNICRCTGFRPIFDAMKSFATDADPKLKQICADIEDLKIYHKTCEKGGKNCRRSCGRYHADGDAPTLHREEDSRQQLPKPRPLFVQSKHGNESSVWLRPDTLQQLIDDVKTFSSQGKQIRFVVGNTSTGVFKNDGSYDVYIDTKLLSEFYQVNDTNSAVTVGANVCLNQLIEALQARATESPAFPVMVKHLKKIANVPVRNVGSWIGNLMMKKMHLEFPSDVFTIFETYSVKLTIHDCNAGTDSTYDLIGHNGFMSLNMDGKIVLSATIPKVKSPEGSTYKALSYKVMPRSQNAHAYVNSAFHATVQGGKIIDPGIVFGGISKSFVHATATEKYLQGKVTNSQATLNGALKVLELELQPESYNAADSSPEYRKSLSLGLFYKFYLSLCTDVSPEVASAVDTIQRPLTSGTQSYDSDASMYPVTEPMPKVTAIKQASGEAKYLTDFVALSDELYATCVVSTVGNADIANIDTSEAMKMPGFHSVITVILLPTIGHIDFSLLQISDIPVNEDSFPQPHIVVSNARFISQLSKPHSSSDLPSEVKNTYISPPLASQVIIADGHVDFAGEPVAIVLADSQDHADAISKAVVVTYTNQQPPVCDMSEAIDKDMFFDSTGDPVVIGDADTAIQNATHKVSGRAQIGSQYHFYMETQVARTSPTEDGFNVECATQWQDLIQMSLSHMFGWDCNRFNIITGRVGGAYGGKAMNSLITTSVSTLASYISGRTVRFHVPLSQCLETYGSRAAYIADYTVGFDDDGLLQGVEIAYFSNSGASVNYSEVDSFYIQQFADSGYHSPNWKLTPKWVKTNIASSTVCRAPLSAQLTMIMEIIMEHVAKSLDADPVQIKQSNLYVKDQPNLFGEPLTYCNIRTLSQSLLTSADISTRQTEISVFNSANKWKKRGLAFTPVKFGVIWKGTNYPAQVSIFHFDGSIVLTCGGTEAGQGLNTKLIQVASYTLGAPMDLIRVKATDITISPNSAPSGMSLTSELCCKGILESCKILKSRLDAAKKELALSDDTTWKDLVEKAFSGGVDFTASYWVFSNTPKNVVYNCYGAACSEVETGIITGEFVIRRVDILYDCGQSINPDIDMGQVEGAFLMGVGFYTSEKMVFDPSTGQLATNSTWQYKPPTSKDIPTVWNISLLKDAPNPTGVLSSKAVGEPPLCTSASVVFAIKRCIEDFKQDKSYFAIDLPATVDNNQQLCKISMTDYKI